MTPQEQQLVNDLFARLAQLENAPRDPDAMRLIAQGLSKAPNAAYTLVQTALVQDEALKRANARIEELQAQLEGAGAAQPQAPQGGFLDQMRDALLGHEQRGSVPTVRPQGGAAASRPAAPWGGAPAGGSAPSGPTGGMAAPSPYTGGPAMGPMGGMPPGGPGGSFLGTAASAAAGAIGGGLLLDSIRGMFGHRAGFTDPFASGEHRQEGATQNAADSDLARQAGIGDIDRNEGRDRHDDNNDWRDNDRDRRDDGNDQSYDSAVDDGNDSTFDDDGSFDDAGGDGGSYDV